MGFNSNLPTMSRHKSNVALFATTKSGLETPAKRKVVAPKKLMISRADFVSFLSFAALIPSVSNAFDGGVGGLGK